MGTQASKHRNQVLANQTGGARRDRTADLLHAMQALSQLSYGPTWRRGTLPDRGQFVKKMNELRAPKRLGHAPSATESPLLPRMAKVASMGGETVPPHTARRMGCASLPSEMPFAVARAADEFVNCRRRPLRQSVELDRCSRQQRQIRRQSHACAPLFRRKPSAAGKRTRCSAPSRAPSWRARAAPARFARAAHHRSSRCRRVPSASAAPARCAPAGARIMCC